MLKLSTLILTVLIPIFSFAGTHGGGVVNSVGNDGGTGGGGVLASAIESTNGGGVLSPVIVYHMGEQDGVVKFAYAQLINNKWDVKKLSATESDITSDMAAKAALDQSQNLHQWIELK